MRIWDWEYYKEERALTGHGWDVKTVEWHPYKSLIVSGSKDNLIKLWDPRTGNSLSTLYGHKNTVMKVGGDVDGVLCLGRLLLFLWCGASGRRGALSSSSSLLLLLLLVVVVVVVVLP